MKYEAPGTLAYWKASPYFRKMPTVQARVADIGPNIAAYRATCGLSKPESEAIQFYGLNHLSRLVSEEFTDFEPLPGWANSVMEAYYEVVRSQSRRIMMYMMLICVREARHMYSMSDSFWKGVEKEFGPGFRKFAEALKGAGEDMAMDKFLSSPPDMSLTDFFRGISYLFDQGSWAHQYGGAAWRDVTDALVRFLKGETSIEVLIDTAYTLQHNTSAIFNKYLMYASFNGGTLLKILDIQRAGMVPEAVISGELSHAGSDLIAMIKTVKAEIPGKIGDVVDWDAVQKLGAKGSYAKKKAAVAAPAPKVANPDPAALYGLPKGSKIVGHFKLNGKESVLQFKRAA